MADSSDGSSSTGRPFHTAARSSTRRKRGCEVHPCSTCPIALAQLTLLRDFVSDDFTVFEAHLFTVFETHQILSESGIRPIQGVGLEIRPFSPSVREC